MQKISLAEAFSSFDDTWSPKVAGAVNDMEVKLAKFEGEFVWHHHEHEDELFLVLRGRLRMRLREGDVVVEPGEFLIVPRGTEHCPVAEPDCEVLLLEPATTVNTGNVRNERTVTDLGRIEHS
ncbi:cupin domain-containing protein [Nonomuraea sp. 3-1Str]|uniref:cupin domain-containing protein n=1 Tax=Nonomuraea sp. 3-1Str TaxID=2929801 RepID=UPI00286257D0|nr:cupin domain-containing protein [Nonomuraea sp. 3-1Str]MDR8409459.1 cupin domain-containing protein [Nonomuraea sp. 3-1Str]